MSIKNVGVEKYKITVEIGYDEFGNRKRMTRIVKGPKSKAVAVEAELIKKYYHTGKKLNMTSLTFEELSKIFMEKYDKISMVTKEGYRKSLNRINPIIGNIKVSKITPQVLYEMYDELKVGTTGKVLGYDSMNNFYKVVNVIFNFAVDREWIERNPHKKNMKPKKEKKEKRFYTPEQVKQLLSCLDNENIKYKALIALALDSGARRAELCALRYSDLDFETGLLRINKSLKVVHGVVDESRPKTDSSIRDIYITPYTIKILKEYKEAQDGYKKWRKGHWKENDRIFTSKDGEYMNPGICDHILRKIVRKYNLPPLCFHSLRHTSASLMLNAGCPIKAVADRLGHKDISTTLEIYSHIFDESKQHSAVVMNNILFGENNGEFEPNGTDFGTRELIH